MVDRSAEFAVETSTFGRLFLSTPTKARDFFNYSLSDRIGLKLESAGGRDVALLVTARLTTERANNDVWPAGAFE